MEVKPSSAQRKIQPMKKKTAPQKTAHTLNRNKCCNKSGYHGAGKSLCKPLFFHHTLIFVISCSKIRKGQDLTSILSI